MTDLLRQLLGRASLAAPLESVPACAHIELLQLALAVGEGPRGWQSLTTHDERTCGFQAPECVHGDQGGAAPGDASRDSANASTVCRALHFCSLEASDNTMRGPARSHGRAVCAACVRARAGRVQTDHSGQCLSSWRDIVGIARGGGGASAYVSAGDVPAQRRRPQPSPPLGRRPT